MKLLHIDSAITGDGSVSRRLTADIVARLRRGDPSLEATYRDLAAEPLGHLTLADMSAADQQTPTLEAFLSADVVVIGAPMYNFNISSQLKAWMTASWWPARPSSTARRAPSGWRGASG